MGKIYVGQTALIFRDSTGIDLSNADTMEIKYIKPDNTDGSWDAEIYGAAIDGVIQYTIESADDLDQAGEWVRWAYITFTNGNIAPGEPIGFVVEEEGDFF